MDHHNGLQHLAQYALKHCIEALPAGAIIGLGTGKTVNVFLDVLSKVMRPHLDDQNHVFVCSSKATTESATACGLNLMDLNQVDKIDLYIDSADACNPLFELIKGQGGALFREKILAAMARQFICLVDEKKYCLDLSDHPVPIEVLPFARSFVVRELLKLGAEPSLKIGFITDNGHQIVNAKFKVIGQPIALEQTINAIPGVIENGLFCKQRPHRVLCARHSGEIVELKQQGAESGH